jgi:hypothetical protein
LSKKVKKKKITLHCTTLANFLLFSHSTHPVTQHSR